MLLGRKCPNKHINAGKVEVVDRDLMVFKMVTVKATQYIIRSMSLQKVQWDFCIARSHKKSLKKCHKLRLLAN